MNKRLEGLAIRGSQQALKIALVINVALIAILVVTRGFAAALGGVLWSALGWLLWLVRPSSRLHEINLQETAVAHKVVIALVCVGTVLMLTLPMALPRVWNGAEPGHRNEYEVLADALLHEKITLYDDEDTSALEALDNPYDPVERDENNVPYHWDHVFYDGHYYSYFGIVPALLVFVPYQLLTGAQLTSYHATQLFAALFVVGVFVLFKLLSTVHRLRVGLPVYLFACVSLSCVCMLCATETPMLYCTANTSAMCFSTWSLICFVKAVYQCANKSSQVPIAFLGSLFGALVFGCRPPVGLMNLLAIPIFVHYLGTRDFASHPLRELGRVALVVSPYVVVAILLGVYNYVRFGNPLDFGAAYQLTGYDIGAYVSFARQAGPIFVINYLISYFFAPAHLSDSFPYLTWGGLFGNYPVFLFACIGIVPASLSALRKRRLAGWLVVLVAIVVAIATLTALWSPDIWERYHMDAYFPLAILLYLAMLLPIADLPVTTSVRRYETILCCLLALTFVRCVLSYFIIYDANFVSTNPEYLELAWRVATLNHLLG